MIAWTYDPEALGPPPPGVEIVDDPSADAEFVVPRWEEVPDLDRMPSLRVVQVLSAGVDWIAGHVPDGVTLCNARGARDWAVAEWVAAAILADAKQAWTCAVQQGRREWALVPLQDVVGRRVLVVGFGSIGRVVETVLTPLRCEVVGVARQARDGVHGADELPDLLGEADVVVNLLPLTDETRGSFGARELGAMRQGALYVNAGRGGTTDTDALVAALETEHIRAALDVVEPEPLPADHALWTAPGVLISPHSAGDTPASHSAAWALAAEQLRRHAAGEQLHNVVARGY